MDPGARLQLNLNVLRRYDPSIAEILDSCSHVVVYQFSEADQTWVHKTRRRRNLVPFQTVCLRQVAGYCWEQSLRLLAFLPLTEAKDATAGVRLPYHEPPGHREPFCVPFRQGGLADDRGVHHIPEGPATPA
ncbi:MAG: hypothetical protein BJ554DRAFT_2578 [Olpidium bornovanus]|uniref:Uncharacterized protein n=1 Tax=Olpidium bornovanus TaxID=278681 RepID=A0A8H8A0W5_9FUNG|nr:MAG: hypothetical protein BJ554DRAFT_2578 [Olpidium bornovanus]